LNPVFPLFLGRKACPPALPLAPRIVSAPGTEAAFDDAGLDSSMKSLKDSWGDWRPRPWLAERSTMLLWDPDAETALKPQETHKRRDQPLSRLRWQFAVRSEHRTHLGDRE
jgi:CRISPR system Cascade subunit CasD